MASNLRSKPISGHITDGAGNVIRNSSIIIKSPTPLGEVIVDTVVTNDDGLFTSAPLPNGNYYIYESGVAVSNVFHNTDTNSIPVYAADGINIGPSSESFSSIVDSDGDLNTFKTYLQIESSYVNTIRYGNTYPLYNSNLGGLDLDWAKSFYSFHSLNGDSRITTTRFDIEYYSPITESSKNYKRVRWSGVPAIKFDNSTRLVIPLDYLSIVASNPKYIDGKVNDPNGGILTEISGTDLKLSGVSTVDTVVGDIVKVEHLNGIWYGIIHSEGTSTISLKEWSSTRVIQTPPNNDDYVKIQVFSGMFQGLSNIGSQTNEFVTVTENVYAQSQFEEMYSYNNAIQITP